MLVFLVAAAAATSFVGSLSSVSKCFRCDFIVVASVGGAFAQLNVIERIAQMN